MHMRNRESDPSIFHRDKEQKEPLNKRYQVCRSCREFPGQSKPKWYVSAQSPRDIVWGKKIGKNEKFVNRRKKLHEKKRRIGIKKKKKKWNKIRWFAKKDSKIVLRINLECNTKRRYSLLSRFIGEKYEKLFNVARKTVSNFSTYRFWLTILSDRSGWEIIFYFILFLKIILTNNMVFESRIGYIITKILAR